MVLKSFDSYGIIEIGQNLAPLPSSGRFALGRMARIAEQWLISAKSEARVRLVKRGKLEPKTDGPWSKTKPQIPHPGGRLQFS
jgi:hypothetical protein